MNIFTNKKSQIYIDLSQLDELNISVEHEVSNAPFGCLIIISKRVEYQSISNMNYVCPFNYYKRINSILLH